MRAQSGPTKRSIARVRASGSLLVALLVTLLLASCTREEVASAMATLAVDLQATLEPLSATVAAGNVLPGLETQAATAEATLPPLPSAATVAPALSPTLPLPSATATPTATPLPSATPEPTTEPSPTPVPTSTPVPSPTPFPTEIELGGAIMRLVPGGEFRMGAAAADMLAECETFRPGCEAAWFAASEPAHSVLISPFYIDQLEVTNVAYLTFLNDPDGAAHCAEHACIDVDQSQLESVDSGPYQIAPELANHPVAGVTWFGADAYCTWRDGRLPTEAEWEKAALWNTDEDSGAAYPWGPDFDGTRVNFCDVNCDAPQANPDYDDGFAEAAPVGSLPDGRSPSGAYDMAGNVWEWVADWYADWYYASSATTDPQGPAEGDEKVVRGGSYFDTGNFTSGFIRFPSAPDNADRTIGFRCAATP